MFEGKRPPNLEESSAILVGIFKLSDGDFQTHTEVMKVSIISFIGKKEFARRSAAIRAMITLKRRSSRKKEMDRFLRFVCRMTQFRTNSFIFLIFILKVGKVSIIFKL